jgi:hypothetical protein
VISKLRAGSLVFAKVRERKIADQIGAKDICLFTWTLYQGRNRD